MENNTPTLNTLQEAMQHFWDAVEYGRGTCHTNGLENYWSLLKRCIKMTNGSIEPFNLFRYLDEEDGRQAICRCGGQNGRQATDVQEAPRARKMCPRVSPRTLNDRTGGSRRRRNYDCFQQSKRTSKRFG